MIGQIDRKHFLTGYRAALGHLTTAQVGELDALLGFVESDADITDIRWAAYILATVKHETADTYEPIDERGGDAYFTKHYGPDTATDKRLGNTRPSDGALFHGRGYVQLTGRDNYHKFAARLAVPLTVHPDMAKEPDTAYRIMSEGMRLGLFTGKRLTDYLNGTRSDYTNARRIINGTDKAALIAGYAAKFDDLLTEAISNTAPAPAIASPAVDGADADDVTLTPASSADTQTITLPSMEAIVGGGVGDDSVQANREPMWKKLTVWAGASGVSLTAVTTVVEKMTGLTPTVQLVLIGSVVGGSLLAGAFIGIRHLLVIWIRAHPNMQNAR